jgi:hypothetical protein
LTARTTTSPKSAMVDWTSMTYFAVSLSGITSVGLSAVAFVLHPAPASAFGERLAARTVVWSPLQ